MSVRKNATGTFWEGGPIKLRESILTREVNTNKNLLDTFTKDLRDRIQDTKIELDRTIQSIGIENSSDLLDLEQSQLEVADLEGLVNEDMNKVQANDFEQKLREAYKLQRQAAKYIVDLKSKYKEVQAKSKALAAQAQDSNKSVLNALADAGSSTNALEVQFNRDQANRLRMAKMVAINPPPKYENSEGFGTAAGMLVFFNEDLEEYFDDMVIIDKAEKCRFIIKTFGKKSSEYKSTIRRFFEQEVGVNLILNTSVTMRVIYKEIVCFVFATRPKGHIGVRKEGESLTNYLHRWFIMMDYCGTAQNAQGSKIIRKIFEKPETLKCDAKVIREFKREYFVRHANEESISKEKLLGFAQRLDMLYSKVNALGTNFVSSVEYVSKNSSETESQEKSQADMQAGPTSLQKILRKIEQLSEQGSRNDSDNLNWRTNNPQRGNGGTYRNFKSYGRFSQGRNTYDHKQRNTAKMSDKECWHCGENGHIRANCRQRQNNSKDRKITHFGRPDQRAQGTKAFTVDSESVCMKAKGNDVREYVQTTIVPGSSEQSLLDTGASLDAICPKLLTEYGIADKIKTEQERFVKLADETLVKIDGTIDIKVNVNGTEYQVNFTVMPNIKPKIIYGTPFLAATGILDEFRSSVSKRLEIESKN